MELSLNERLEKLGLLPNEAKVYVALLELGKGAVTDISKAAKLNRTTGYDILERLCLRGVANRALTGKTKIYTAEPPYHLRQYLENKVKWMSETTLQRHLKSMATANILIAHRIGNRYTDLGKAMLPFGLMAFGDGPPAGAFKCYTLPGMSPIFKTQKE